MDSLLNARKGTITEQQLLKDTLAHFRGVRHPDDAIPSLGIIISKLEPWVASIRELALAENYQPLKGEVDRLSRITKS